MKRSLVMFYQLANNVFGFLVQIVSLGATEVNR